MSARDFKVILGYLVLFGLVLFGFGMEDAVMHRFPEGVSLYNGSMPPVSLTSSSESRPAVARIRR